MRSKPCLCSAITSRFASLRARFVPFAPLTSTVSVTNIAAVRLSTVGRGGGGRAAGGGGLGAVVECLGAFCIPGVGLKLFDREHIVDKGGDVSSPTYDPLKNIIGNIVLALHKWNNELRVPGALGEKSLVYGRGLQMAARFWIRYADILLLPDDSKEGCVRTQNILLTANVPAKVQRLVRRPMPFTMRTPDQLTCILEETEEFMEPEWIPRSDEPRTTFGHGGVDDDGVEQQSKRARHE
jgi:hypothetical protein